MVVAIDLIFLPKKKKYYFPKLHSERREFYSKIVNTTLKINLVLKKGTSVVFLYLFSISLLYQT